jgi:hypothetical protein
MEKVFLVDRYTHAYAYKLLSYVCRVEEKLGCLHNLALVPEEGVGVEVLGRVEPKVKPLLTVTYTINIHIGLHCVRFTGGVAEELKIKLIVIWTVR